MSRRVVDDRELYRLIRDAVKEAFALERDARRKMTQKATARTKRPAPHALPQQDGFASVNEVAKYFSVSKHTIYRMISTGKIKATTVGELKRILWSDIYDVAFG